MTSKKIHRMHFIGSYNFLNSDDFEEEEERGYYDTNNNKNNMNKYGEY